MFRLISIVLAVLGALVFRRLLFSALRTEQSQVRFIRTTLARRRRGSNQVRVIATLSSLPSRIGRLQPAIRSLLRQTRPPDEIVIAIPDFSRREQRPYVVPRYLAESPRVRVLRCKRDWGPATKFIPVIQEELAASRDDTLVMVVDDDRVYPRDALETYLYYHEQLPEAALCFRGAAMPSSFDWRQARMLHGFELRQPQAVAVITGCGSYFIQPRFFDESLWNYSNAPRGAFYMDDIWISGCLGRRGVKRYVVPSSGMMRTVLRQMGTLTLHDVPGGRQRHNNETISFFRETWDVFPPR
jgi:hypothetical protein